MLKQENNPDFQKGYNEGRLERDKLVIDEIKKARQDERILIKKKIGSYIDLTNKKLLRTGKINNNEAVLIEQIENNIRQEERDKICAKLEDFLSKLSKKGPLNVCCMIENYIATELK